MLAAADGALGFWSALRDLEEFESTKEQRCWVHKIRNILTHLPKSLHQEVKLQLHDMMRSPNRETAEKVKTRFERNYEKKYPKAVERLLKVDCGHLAGLNLRVI